MYAMFRDPNRRTTHNTHAPCVAAWTLQALQHRDHWRAYSGANHNPVILRAAGIEHSGARGPSRSWLKLKVDEQARQMRANEVDRGVHGPGIQMVGGALGLSRLDLRIVTFLFYYRMDGGLRAVMNDLHEAFGHKGDSLTELWALLIGAEPADLLKALRPNGTLYAAGAVDVDLEFNSDSAVLPVLTTSITAAIRARPESEHEVLTRFIGVGESSPLGLKDFEHLDPALNIAARYLRGAVRKGVAGVNLLLHGLPGAGKTALAHVLGEYAKASVYLVRDADGDGYEACRDERLQSYCLGQRLLGARGDAVIIFDEVEDVFGWSRPGQVSSRDGSKGWLNRLLEANRAPAIWITNDAQSMDPAMLRRFDMALHLDKLARPARVRVARNLLANVPVRESTIAAIAADDRITPADIERAARVATVAHGRRRGPIDAPLMEVLDANLQVRSGPTVCRYPHDERSFDVGLLNADMDPAELVDGLCRSRRGRICLYGPPGTGKTAFAHHVGGRLGLPVLHKRASDMLDKFVGGTEERIAAAFDEAQRQSAVLLLDEADSFLRDRRAAQRSFEVSQVNELLVQMEAFDGVLVCATNLDSSLDLASARRFDCHVRFGALTEDGRWLLFTRTVADAGHSTRSRAHLDRRAAVDTMQGLVVGDFNVARRRAEMLGRSLDGPTLLAWLGGELERRDKGGKPVGFMKA